MSDDRPTAGPRWHPRGLNNGAIFGATCYGVSRLPPWLSYGIGHIGTWLAYHLMEQGTEALASNLSVMFPELNRQQMNALALRTYRSYARDVIDFLRSLRLSTEATRTLITRFDTAAIEQAMAERRGAIILSGHFGNWEIGGVFMSRLTSYKLSVVVRPEPDEAVGRLRQQMRADLGIDTIEVRQQVETALHIRERLRRNEVVGMLLDRHFGKDHVEVSFFGRSTKFLRTPAMLAALAEAPLVPCFVYRDGEGFAVECGPLVRVLSSGNRAADVQQATQTVAELFEGKLRRHPHYWYQFYPVWPSADAPAPSH
jgi:KDO2-lipid IV(A) lauroyltransferase